MKKRNLLVSLIALFALSGCEVLDNFFAPSEKTPIEEKESKEENNNQIDNNQNENNNDDEKEDDNHDDGTTDDENQKEELPNHEPPTIKTKVGEFYGGVVENENYVGYEFSKSEESISRQKNGKGEIDIYAFNDFHGAVLETENEVGLKRLGSFFKAKSQENNTLILDQGDTWQGSFESNYQYGAIVQDVFNYAGVSLRTVGNHDFDWGLSHLEETNNRKLGDDYIPCLASNVFDYENGINGDIQQSNYGKEYATFILDNGLKVGVVGVIGSSQITSICSQLVETICFTNHVEKAKEISDYLRVEKKCDIVIASTHESSANMYYSNLSDVSPVSNKRYADLVLSGHAHNKQDYTDNGVKFVQWDSNGQSTGLIKLVYDFENNELIHNETSVETYYPNYLRTYYPSINPTINEMIDDYLEATTPFAEEVLSTNFSGYWSTTNLGNLMCEAIYDSVKNAGISVDFAVCNYARQAFNKSEFTFGDLYKCFPFDNQIILMDVSDSYAQQNIDWNESYRENTSTVPVPGVPCRIAVIDYLGLHQNENRQYDKFVGATNLEIYKDENDEPLIYRNILKDFLLKNSTKQFNSSDYSSSNPHFSVN